MCALPAQTRSARRANLLSGGICFRAVTGLCDTSPRFFQRDNTPQKIVPSNQEKYDARPPHFVAEGRFLGADNILEKADAQVGESIRKLSRATSAMADAIDEGVRVIKRAAKRSGEAAEELMDDTKQQVKRHPVETVVTSLAAGVVTGVFIGWMMHCRFSSQTKPPRDYERL